MSPLPLAAPSVAKTGRAPARPQVAIHLLLVSPKQARAMTEEIFPGQRPLRPAQVQFLRQLMEHGTFRPGTCITFAVLEKTRYLINGQHTLTALGQTQQAQWLHIEEIRVPDLDTAGRLYATYDRNLARSWNDLYRADQGLARLELLPKQLAQVSGALPFLAAGFHYEPQWGHGFGHALRDATRRFALLADWEPEALNFYNGCHGPLSIRHLLTRAAVLSIALVTYRWQPEAAHRFWPSVARDSGLRDGDPAKTLLRWLYETPARKVRPMEYCRYVAGCWNASFEDRAMPRMLARAMTQPLLLQGTPHDGKTVKRYLTPSLEVTRMPVETETETL